MCVWERETDRDRERERERNAKSSKTILSLRAAGNALASERQKISSGTLGKKLRVINFTGNKNSFVFAKKPFPD